MRIAIVINTAWNIHNFRMGLIRSLLAANHEIHAIAPSDGYERHLIRAGCRYHPVLLDNKGTNPAKDIGYTRQLYALYREIRPDVVLHFTIKPNLYGTLAAKLAGIPVINNVSGLGTVFLRENMASKVARALYRFIFRFPDKVFFQNSDDLDYFVGRNLVNASITDVLPGSGVDLSYFCPDTFSRNQTFTFLLAARLIRDKGICEYAEAARRLKHKGVNARFLLVGFMDESPFGVSKEILSQWTGGGWIEYQGSTDDIRTAIRQADCVVLPSYREGTPRSLLEAAAMGKPLVATNVPGCVEVVENEVNGFLCEAQDAEGLATQMLRMLALDDAQLERMGRASRHKAEVKFDENFVVQKYHAAITALLKQPAAIPESLPMMETQ